jgi:hypothetical protein
MIYDVVLSQLARCVMDIYFESYQGTPKNNDMQKRAFNYSRIINCLAHFDAYTENTYIFNGKNCLDIDNICRVEFAKNQDEILIVNINFKTL